jgi:hypothetical protein
MVKQRISHSLSFGIIVKTCLHGLSGRKKGDAFTNGTNLAAQIEDDFHSMAGAARQ